MPFDPSNIDKTWTLFLDRDGVINRKRDNDYVKSIDEFEVLSGALSAIAQFSQQFGRVLIVTNQQGIGKGIMSKDDLSLIHAHLLEMVQREGGRIDRIYYCPDLAVDNPPNRKPNPGMGLQAQKDYPEIDFDKTIMVGDSSSDEAFAKNLGAHFVGIGLGEGEQNFDSLINFAQSITSE